MHLLACDHSLQCAIMQKLQVCHQCAESIHSSSAQLQQDVSICKPHYEMLTASLVVGVHVKIPVEFSKTAPVGRSDFSCNVTLSEIVSEIVTLIISCSSTVAFTTKVTLITGL